MSAAGFQWSDEQPKGPASGATPASGGDSRFTWSDAAPASTSDASPAPKEPPTFLNTLGREGSALGKTILGMPGAIYHSFADEPTAEETAEAGGPQEVHGAKRIGLGLERMVKPVAVAGEWYRDAAEGKIPDPVGQALTGAPEAMGAGAGAAIGGKLIDSAPAFVRSQARPVIAAIRGPEPVLPATPAAAPQTGEYVDTPAPAPTRSGPPIAHAEVVQPKLLPQSASVARDLPYRMGPGEVAPEDVNAPDPNVLAGRQGIRVAPPIPQRPGLALPEAQDPILERLRANAARIAQEGHGDEIPEPVEASPITTNLNDDLTPALKASLRKALAAKRVRAPKPQPIQ